MKILLIKPIWQYPITPGESTYNRIWPPISLVNCASLLIEDGHDVRILDAHAERISPEKISKYIIDVDRIFVTSSSLDRWQCPNLKIDSFLQTVSEIRKKTPEVYVLGYHGSFAPNDMLKITEAKAVIRGEPEFTVLDICRKKHLNEVKGITYRVDNEIISTPNRELFSMDALPIPSLSLLDNGKYLYEILGNKFTIFEGSRGCPYKCTFCQKIMFGHGIRMKSTERLIQEVKRAIVDFGIETAYFIDLEFTYNKKLVDGLCDYLIKNRHRFKWCCQTRTDDVTEEILIKMKKAGCELIHYGVETGSPRIMGLINKERSLRHVEEIVKLTEKIGIKALCFFIFGFPTESDSEREETIRFAKKLIPSYVSFHANCNYPGSEFHSMLKNESTMNELDQLVYINKQKLDNLRKIIRKAFIRFYLSPNYIISRITKGNLSNIIHQLRLFWAYVRR